MSSSESKFVLGILVGAAFGAVMGMLWAPRSGRETRKILKEEISHRYYDSLDAVKDGLEETRTQVMDKVDQKTKEIKESVQGLTKELQETGRKAISSITSSVCKSEQSSEQMNGL